MDDSLQVALDLGYLFQIDRIPANLQRRVAFSAQRARVGQLLRNFVLQERTGQVCLAESIRPR